MKWDAMCNIFSIGYIHFILPLRKKQVLHVVFKEIMIFKTLLYELISSCRSTICQIKSRDNLNPFYGHQWSRGSRPTVRQPFSYGHSFVLFSNFLQQKHKLAESCCHHYVFKEPDSDEVQMFWNYVPFVCVGIGMFDSYSSMYKEDPHSDS